MKKIELEYHAHSCFTLGVEGYRIVIDPYCTGMFPWLGELHLNAEEVLCTHGHGDHAHTAAVALEPKPCPVKLAVTRIPCAHDDHGGQKRGMNNLLLFEAEGLRAAHLGDIGCDLTPEQKAPLFDLDALMIPVGGYYTIDAAQAAALAKELRAKVIIPMHYCPGAFWEKDSVITTVSPFLAQFKDVTRLTGSTVVVDGSEQGVALPAWPL